LAGAGIKVVSFVWPGPSQRQPTASRPSGWGHIIQHLGRRRRTIRPTARRGGGATNGIGGFNGDLDQIDANRQR